MDKHSLTSIFLIIPIAGFILTVALLILEKIINNIFQIPRLYMRHKTIRKVGWPPYNNMDADGDIMTIDDEEEGDKIVDTNRRPDDLDGSSDHKRQSEG